MPVLTRANAIGSPILRGYNLYYLLIFCLQSTKCMNSFYFFYIFFYALMQSVVARSLPVGNKWYDFNISNSGQTRPTEAITNVLESEFGYKYLFLFFFLCFQRKLTYIYDPHSI